MKIVKVRITDKEGRTLNLLEGHSLLEPFWGDSVLLTVDEIIKKILQELKNETS